MKLEARKVLFVELGKYLNAHLDSEEIETLTQYAKSKNPWFTSDNVKKSIQSISDSFLTEDNLSQFTAKYQSDFFSPAESKKVGIVAAGNVPMVGFQDLIHVVLSGHIAYFKASSQDEVLMTYIINKLKELNPEAGNYIVLADKLNGLDAYIATGSGNTSRYFEYYFGNKPNIIRKNRISIAVLDGKESKTELSDLGNDIFTFFGLGCRNVSKMYVPKGYNFTPFYEAIEYWNSITLHSKYVNNYDYNKSIMLVNGDKHFDNGFLLLKETTEMHSPISAIFYEEYEDLNLLQETILKEKDNLQCVVSHLNFEDKVAFGRTQSPELWDFADGVDTIQFLKDI